MIIGIAGRAGSGKTEVARVLQSHGYTIKPFAGPLKTMLAAIGVPTEALYGSQEDKARPLPMLCGKSAREAMQALGTEWGRDCIHHDLWVKLWVHSLPGGDVVADDLRFANEAQAIRDAGGLIVQVVRPGSRDTAGSHASERFDGIEPHVTIVNDGTVLDLRKTAATIARMRVPKDPFKINCAFTAQYLKAVPA